MNSEFYDYDMQQLLNYMKKGDPDMNKVCFFVKNENQDLSRMDTSGLNVEYILKPLDPAEVLSAVERGVFGRFQFTRNGE